MPSFWLRAGTTTSSVQLAAETTARPDRAGRLALLAGLLERGEEALRELALVVARRVRVDHVDAGRLVELLVGGRQGSLRLVELPLLDQALDPPLLAAHRAANHQVRLAV